MASILQSPLILSFGTPHMEVIVHAGQQVQKIAAAMVLFLCLVHGPSLCGAITSDSSIVLTRRV